MQLCSFAVLCSIQDYGKYHTISRHFGKCISDTCGWSVRPEFTETLAIKALRHPIREKIHKERFVPNDVYASQQSR
jgi:hypothetical protein